MAGKSKTIDALEEIRKLAKIWSERAELQNLKGRERDERCMDFFTGAACLAISLHGYKSPITVLLLKVNIYVIGMRGEKGLTDYCQPKTE